MNGHTSCRKCYDQLISKYKSCPLCKSALHRTPILIRINNDQYDTASSTTQQVQTTQGQTTVFNMSTQQNKPIVLLVDTSGSMDESSEIGKSKILPKRIELVVHMMKIMYRFCKELNIKFVPYEFNSTIRKIPISDDMTESTVFSEFERLRSTSCTNLGLALESVYRIYNNNVTYFVFTDGESSDSTDTSVRLFNNANLHLISFSKDVKTQLLDEVSAAGRRHTISYVQDINSLMGYMIPIFIYANTMDSTKELSQNDENLRQEYVRILEPQTTGNSSIFTKEHLIQLLLENKSMNNSPYCNDLIEDTVKNERHGRIHYSFSNKDNWNNFGKFYLKCILHCHKYKIVGNAFDVSVQHYKTEEYQQIYSRLSGKAENIEYVAFTQPAHVRNQTSAESTAKITKTIKYVDTYSGSSSMDDGCISPDAVITMKDGVKLMKDLKVGDITSTGTVKWIICITDLNGGMPFEMYNGLSKNHPVCIDGYWIPASKQLNSHIFTTTDVVYDIVLEETNVDHILVNNIKVAAVGYPIPGMIHPYWGSNKVIEDLETHYPGDGYVSVNSSNFKYKNGLLVSLF